MALFSSSTSDTRTSQGVLLVVQRPATEGLPAATGTAVLVSWEMQDPGNVGGLVRTAEASGCSALVLAASAQGPLVDAFSPRAVRAAASSSFRLPIHEWRGAPADLASALRAAGLRPCPCVPMALSILAAAYLNEEKLSNEQLSGIRYLSLVTIYVSSTADIFINGVANSPWLPLILGSFALAGVFAGIVFRVRGMTLMGSIFLLLSIVMMIWYASANFGWTWLWYVFGIVTGAAIILTFAVFEKKKHADARG